MKPTRSALPFSAVGGTRGFKRERDDFYPTPRALSDPLIARDLDHLLKSGAWDCACGDGALCRALEAQGVRAVGSDLVNRGYGASRRDFLMEGSLPDGVAAIITNPPFQLWREFAEHATRMGAPYIALLGRLQLLEGKRVSRIFKATGLSRVLVSAGRVNMLPPGAIDKGHSGMMAWAWFCWLPGHTGAPLIEWFEPDRASKARPAARPVAGLLAAPESSKPAEESER